MWCLLLLRGHENVYLTRNVGVELNVCLEFSKGLDRLCKRYLSLVDVDAVLLFELLGDVLGGFFRFLSGRNTYRFLRFLEILKMKISRIREENGCGEYPLK